MFILNLDLSGIIFDVNSEEMVKIYLCPDDQLVPILSIQSSFPH